MKASRRGSPGAAEQERGRPVMRVCPPEQGRGLVRSAQLRLCAITLRERLHVVGEYIDERRASIAERPQFRRYHRSPTTRRSKGFRLEVLPVHRSANMPLHSSHLRRKCIRSSP